MLNHINFLKVITEEERSEDFCLSTNCSSLYHGHGCGENIIGVTVPLITQRELIKTRSVKAIYKKWSFSHLYRYIVAKRKEKIRKNNKFLFLVNSISEEKTTVGKKRKGRPPLSDIEKNASKKRKLEKDRERLRAKRNILTTP